MDGFVLSEEEGEQINFRGTRMLIKVSKDDSEGRYSLIEIPSLIPSYATNLGIPLTSSIAVGFTVGFLRA